MTATTDRPLPGATPAVAVDKTATLAAAFDAFNAVSRDLEESYRTLQREAARLRRQLRGANRGREAEARSHAELAHKLNALIEALPGGVLLLDAGGRIQQANSAAAAMLGEPLVGHDWNRIRERSFAGAAAGQGEVELASGRRVNIAQKPLQPGPGRVLLLTDITDARRFEDLLARHRRLASMGEMAAALAHQIRTPLAAGLLYATNASRPELPGAQRDALLGKAIGCLQDLERLIADMLRFARGATLAEQRLDVAGLLDCVEDSLRPIVTPRQSLTVTRPAAAVALNGNREALAGALINLGTNALHAAGEQGHVRITARAAGLQAEILVSDDGPGIPEALRSRIFDPFFTSRPDGTGLGLAVARSVARAHHGDVLLIEAAPRRTTFALRLPLAQTDDAGTSSHRNAAA